MNGKMVCLSKMPHIMDMKYMAMVRINRNRAQTDLVKNIKNRFQEVL